MPSAHYAYLNTRISVLAARLLSRSRCEELVEQVEPDYSGIAGLEDFDDQLRRAKGSTVLVEHSLLSALLQDVRILVRGLAPPDRHFLLYSVQWFELANLKALIRGKFAGLDSRRIRANLVDTHPFTTLPMDELLEAEDPAELLRRLEATVYADLARHARRVFEEKQDMFSLNAAIDRKFMEGLRVHALGVVGSDQQGLRELIGVMFDQFNLNWLLRFRLNYRLSAAETFFQLLPGGRWIDSARLEELARLSSLQEIIEALPPSLARPLSGAERISQVENRMQIRMRSMLDRYLNDTRFPVVRAFAYLIRRELEMRNLSAVIKGKNLGFEQGLIRYAANLEGELQHA
jgi:V/A-type H+-transporting ATPase subunit C